MEKKIEKLKTLKLLFVEDEEDLIEIITDTLTKLDADFLTARNGQEALTVIEENNDIDVIITDINMPVMNGLDMINAIQKRGLKISIIVMSAHTEVDYLDKAKKLGVDEYLLKPFDFIKFIDLLISLDIKK